MLKLWGRREGLSTKPQADRRAAFDDTNRYHLVVMGSSSTPGFPTFKRRHASYADAYQAGLSLLAHLPHATAHPAYVFGPGCPPEGQKVE